MSRHSHLREDYIPATAGIAGPLFPDRAPIAAAGDPETSHLAAYELDSSGQRRAQKRALLRFLLEIAGTPRTSAEIARDGGFDRHMVARRLPDLEADSLAHRCGKRKCEATGHEAITWEAGR